MTSGMLFSNLSWNLITAERPHMCAIAWLSLQQCVQNLKVGACWVCCPGHWIIFSGRAGLAPGVVSGIGLTHKFDRKSSREWFHYRTLWAYIMVHPWVTMIACTHNVPQWIVQDQSISSLTLNLCVQWHVLRNTTYNILLILFRRTLQSRRVLRRRYDLDNLDKAPEAPGLLENQLVIGLSLGVLTVLVNRPWCGMCSVDGCRRAF